MEECAEAMGNIPAELGPALKMIGTVLQNEWMSREGQYLSKDERDERGKVPLAHVDDTFIQIRLGDMILKMVPSDDEKAAVSIPVGMSDKKNTAAIPRDWLIGCWIDALVCVFDGDPSVAQKFAGRVNEAIDAASTTDDDGRLSITQKNLPAHRNPIEVAEIVDSMKRHFHGKSAGSPKLNMTFMVEKAGATSEQPQTIGITEEVLSARVDDALVPNPTVAAESQTTVTAQEGSVVEASHPHTPEPAPALVEEEVLSDDDGASSDTSATCSSDDPCEVHGDPEHFKKNGWPTWSCIDSNDSEEYVDSTDEPIELGVTGAPLEIEQVIMSAINNCGNTDGATWGLIKKTASADGSHDDLQPHRKVLDKLVKAGLVNKEGERRSTRYLLTGAGLEATIGMPLPDVASQDLERVSMEPSGDSVVAVAREADHEQSPTEPSQFQKDVKQWMDDRQPETGEGYSLGQLMEQHLGGDDTCHLCDQPMKFIAFDLPTGPKPFCSEKCFCEYGGLEYKGEGYYGFTEEPVEPLPDEYLEHLDMIHEEANEEIQRAIDAQGDDYTTLSYPDDEEPPLEGNADSEPATDAVSEAQVDDTPDDARGTLMGGWG